jgi:N utilization substance protein B
MGQRREARELAVQVLYMMELNRAESDELRAFFWEGRRSGAAVRRFADELIDGVESCRDEIDGWIRDLASNWDVDRIAVVDRNVMRVALYEMLYREDIPAAVSINEAVDIAKRFSTAESGAFVNGILDRARIVIGREPGPGAAEVGS